MKDKLIFIISEASYAHSLLVAVIILIPIALLLRGAINIRRAIGRK